MILETEQRIETTAPIDSTAKPPPHPERVCRLFQTIDELHARHGNATRTKDRVMHAAAAFIVGSLLFAALYGVILLQE